MTNKEQVPHINVDYFEGLTGKVKHSDAGQVEPIGNRVKRLRQEKGLTLEDLAKATGYDHDYLEKLEQGDFQPQLGTIMKLSKALDGALSTLMTGGGHSVYAITRKDEGKSITRTASARGQKKIYYTYQGLAPEVQGRHMEPLKVQLEENPDEEMSIHDGEEFIFVLQGTVLLKIGDEKFELQPGDSAYYLSTAPHLVAAKEGQALILAVLYE